MRWHVLMGRRSKLSYHITDLFFFFFFFLDNAFLRLPSLIRFASSMSEKN
jgi:hypothetical protein